jgi:hypothetical protein
MRLFFLLFLSLIIVNIGVAQESKGDTKDGRITVRMTPEGSFKDSLFVDYSGVWSRGLERNRFIPCGNWTPDSLGGVAFIPNRIGVSQGEKVWGFIFKTHPDTVSFIKSLPEKSNLDLFIEAKGWLIGPGAYDHFGTNHYTIKTTEFKDVRWAIPDECIE